MPQNILLAIDLSARSDRPFARAKLLSEYWDAKRDILFVSDEKIENDTDKIQALILRNYGKDAQGCNIIVKHGSPVKIISETAKQLQNDIIIVGAARHNNISDFFLGTAVDHLVHQANQPVLIVKERPHIDYKHILMATDFSESSAHAFRTALDFFPNTKIELVHAYHVAYEAWLKSGDLAAEMREKANGELQNFMADMNLSDHDASRTVTHIVEGNLHQSVYKMLSSGDFDLLVLGSHGRSGFSLAAIGSRASEMMCWSPTDVLMVKKPMPSQ